MKLLILTQYYPPEVGAPQNRLHELAIRLKNMGAEVHVLTAMPNYPSMRIQESYRGKFRTKETIDGILVYRSWIYVSKSRSIFSRLLNYFSFTWTSFWSGWLRLGTYDILFCESPPLFLGITGRILSSIKRAKFVFNVSDLWPESAEKLKLISNRILLNSAYALEKSLYKKAALITGQTQGIVKDISERTLRKDIYWLPNGADLSLFDPDRVTVGWRKQNGFKDEDLLWIYAGIIGHAQGLEVILKAAQRFKEDIRNKFLLLGSGPEKKRLQAMAAEMQLNNIFFMEPVPKNNMPAILKEANGVIVPLKKLDLFKGAIPSKIFEACAMRKPILLGVEGEAYDLFIQKGNAGLFFIPENDNALTDAIRQLGDHPEICKTLGENGRRFVQEHFDRDQIAKDLYSRMKNLLSS